MILRVALLGLIACGLAGFGTIVWMVMPHNDVAAAALAPTNKIRVLVAAKALKAGSLLKTEDLVVREIDEDKMAEGYFADEPGARRGVMGSMVRRPFSPGDVLTNAEILRPGDHGFLSAVLRPGFRAVTVAVDAISGTAGLIWPGDHVDLILTQQLDDQVANTPGRRIAAETVQRDVRVIAIDQQLVTGSTGSGDSMQARTITLEVSSTNAEQVQVATRLGRLSLAVRSAERGPSDEKEGTTWAGDVSSALGNTVSKPIAAPTMKVFAGSGDGKEFKF